MAEPLATIMPVGMLFVSSIGVVSHHWTGNTDDAHIITGAQVIVDTCRRILGRKARRQLIRQPDRAQNRMIEVMA
jgi:hypothetical protein